MQVNIPSKSCFSSVSNFKSGGVICVSVRCKSDTIEHQLTTQLTQEERGELEQKLNEIRSLLEPTVFDRPRVKNKRLSDIVLPQDPFA